MAQIINLRHMCKGQKGVVKAVTAAGELGRRIRDMGLVPGTEIQVLHRAPLKDPVALRVRNFTITLRNNEADFLDVEVEEPACAPGADNG
jgi:ferrous iron transport protein A